MMSISCIRGQKHATSIPQEHLPPVCYPSPSYYERTSHKHRRHQGKAETNVHLVVITGAKIYHDVLISVGTRTIDAAYTRKAQEDIPVEEHHRAGVIQLVHLPSSASLVSIGPHMQLRATHLVEVRNLRNIDQVDDSEILDLVRDGVERLVHDHALRVPVVAEAEDDDSVFLRFDRFVDMPA